MEEKLTPREAELRISQLNLEYKMKKNEMVRRREQLSLETNSAIEGLKKNYIKEKAELIGEIAGIRQKRCGLAMEDPQRDTYNAQIREREMKLSLLRGQLDLDINETKTASSARRHEIDEESRREECEFVNQKLNIMALLKAEKSNANANAEQQ